MVKDVILQSEVFREGKTFVSLCPELNVSSFGYTKKEAFESLKEALSLFLEECRRMGTLEDVLGEAGFEVRDSQWVYRKPLATEEIGVALAMT